jgi:predicted transcriptional regulator
MAQIEVPEKAAAELQELALRDQRSLQDIAVEAIQSYLSFRHLEPELTAVEIDRMKHSLAQAEQGELVPQEEVEAFFDNWDKEIASR